MALYRKEVQSGVCTGKKLLAPLVQKPAASSQMRVALVAAKTPLGLLLSWNPLLAPQKWLAVPVTPRSGAECRDD